MHHATFAIPDLMVFCRLDEPGLVAVGQRLDPDRVVIECRVAEPDPWWRGCGSQALSRGTDVRLLAHEPFGHRPTTLLVRVHRDECSGCGRSWREDLTAAAAERAKLSRRGMRWALEGIVIDHLTVSRVAAGLGVSWHTANDAVLAEGRRLLIDDPGRFDEGRVLGVDEHVWRHTRFGDTYVTVIIDLTPVHEKTDPSRLLDIVDGRSKAVLKTWLAARPQAWRDAVEIVAMDEFCGFTTAASEELPDAVTVMDPFHVVRLAGDALDECRRRIQRDAFGRRGRKEDPLYKARRTLHTGAGLLTETQRARLEELFANEQHAEVEATWGVYQAMITAYREPDRKLGKFLMQSVINSLTTGVPTVLVELRRLGRTLKQRAADVLAFSDRPGTSNGPTQAINSSLEHLRGSALGFPNLTNYIARSLLETGGFRNHPHPRLR